MDEFRQGAACQGQDFREVFAVHHVLDRQEFLQTRQHCRSRRFHPVLHLPTRQTHQHRRPKADVMTAIPVAELIAMRGEIPPMKKCL